MKTKKFLCIALIILALLIPNIVKAEDSSAQSELPVGENAGTKNDEEKQELTWTDVSNLKLEVINDNSFTSKVSYTLKVSGITETEGHFYYNFITNSATEPNLEYNSNGIVKDENKRDDYILFSQDRGHRIDKFIEKNGDIYYWLLEVQKEDDETTKYVHKFIVSGKKIERPKQLELGKRTDLMQATTETLVVNINTPIVDSAKRNGTVKIGQITDNSILLAIKNNESNALNKLLSYAKTAKSIYKNDSFAFGDGKDNGKLLKKDLIKNAYYYIYVELNDENGKYYPVEDIKFCQAHVSNSIDSFYLSTDEINWDSFTAGDKTNQPTDNKEQSVPKDNTTANGSIPQTGEIYTTLVSIVVLITVALIFAYKYNKYKEIK